MVVPGKRTRVFMQVDIIKKHVTKYNESDGFF